MVGKSVGPEQVAYVRARSTSVVLGSASALAQGVVLPQMAQAGLITIPLWRKLLTRRSPRAR